MPRMTRRKFKEAILQQLLEDTPIESITQQDDAEKNTYMSFDVATKSIAFCIVALPKNYSRTFHDLNIQFRKLSEQINTIRQGIDTVAIETVENQALLQELSLSLDLLLTEATTLR